MMLDNENTSGLAAGETHNGTSPESAPYNGKPDELHDLFGAGGSMTSTDEEDPLAELRNDPNYAALIRDLEYIAHAAKDLFQPETPSDALWDKIKNKLGEEPTEA
jgi:hypothetical protein